MCVLERDNLLCTQGTTVWVLYESYMYVWIIYFSCVSSVSVYFAEEVLCH